MGRACHTPCRHMSARAVWEQLWNLVTITQGKHQVRFQSTASARSHDYSWRCPWVLVPAAPSTFASWRAFPQPPWWGPVLLAVPPLCAGSPFTHTKTDCAPGPTGHHAHKTLDPMHEVAGSQKGPLVCLTWLGNHRPSDFTWILGPVTL